LQPKGKGLLGETRNGMSSSTSVEKMENEDQGKKEKKRPRSGRGSQIAGEIFRKDKQA